jgi:hypothetical protein
LYYYLPELKSLRNSTDSLDLTYIKYLDLFIQYIKIIYADTRTRLLLFLISSEIPYKLLWVFFKPNTFAYIIYPRTKKPRYIKYDFGEKKTTSDRVEYFYIRGCYVDFDKKIFSKVFIQIRILKFRGSKPINSLDVFFIRYYKNANQVKIELVKCDQKFGFLKSIRYF